MKLTKFEQIQKRFEDAKEDITEIVDPRNLNRETPDTKPAADRSPAPAQSRGTGFFAICSDLAEEISLEVEALRGSQGGSDFARALSSLLGATQHLTQTVSNEMNMLKRRGRVESTFDKLQKGVIEEVTEPLTEKTTEEKVG